uniref:alpha-1,2-Mannosidase n=1 Tax=Globisporangium ultimum (strain ATCC 200006 / CBS 805.95 / DAOM BR144) TaxID=431595 RepID=K3W8C9_GLOUD
MHASERRYLQEQAREMFYHGYQNYMEHAFPWDELKPLSCEGRRWDRRERGDLDDVLGGYSLTLIDSLDMLAILGDRDEFVRAVKLVIEHVSFDRDVTVSVFESTIRVIGGLVSAHMLASPQHLGIMTADEYNGELLDLAVDLGQRLLPAFDTMTGIPVHRIHLQRGIVNNTPTMTCPAAAGSLLVELSYLSRLSALRMFEDKARNAVVQLWLRRSTLDLLGSSIDVSSGEWIHSHVSIGAGLDSYFEYLLKYHLISGDTMWLEMFNMSYTAVETHINHDDLHIEVDMNYGRQHVRSRRVSALQAFWPGLQVLAGDVSSAIRSHDKLFSLWDKFGAMPELFDLAGSGSVISWARSSPLRPELIESTYHLYQATRDHKYLKIGRKLLQDIQSVSKVPCGYAAVGDIHTLQVEDRMDSYFLSETVKYLYLLFSEDPDVIVPSFPVSTNSTGSNSSRSSNASVLHCGSCRGQESRNATRSLKSSQVVFSTEGHLLMLDSTLFERERGGQSALPHPECENANTLVQSAAASAKAAAMAASQAVAPTTTTRIGISVRVEDVHVMTLVAWPAKFGQQITRETHVELPLLLYSSRIHEGCDRLSKRDAALVRGNLVFVARGTCTFAEKALRMQNAGAAGVIIVNTKVAKSRHPDRKYVVMDDKRGLGKQVHIPVMLSVTPDGAVGNGAGNDKAEQHGTTSEEVDEPVLLAALSPWLH